LDAIRQDEEDALILSRQIEARRKRRNLMAKCVEDIEGTLVISTKLQVAAQGRIEENLERISEFTKTEKTLKINISPAEAEERSTAMNFCNIFALYRQEIERYRALVEADMVEAKEATSRTHDLEQQLLEAKSRLTQENKGLGFLEVCREQIMLAISEKRGLISPGRFLPEETLIAIFQHIITDTIDLTRKDPKCSRNFVALKLSSVCQRWRKILQHTPSVWTYIPIAIPSPIASYSRRLAATYHYLFRCENLRTLTLHWPRNGPWSVGEVERRDIFNRFSPVEHVLCTDPLAYYIAHAPEGLHDLKYLELIGRDKNVKVDCQIPAKSLVIWELHPTFNSITIAAGVTEMRLHIRDTTALILSSILSSLTNLSFLELDIPGGCSNNSTTSIAPITLRNLRKLIASTKIIIQVLGIVVIAPGLCQISVDGEGAEPQSPENWNSCTDRTMLKENTTHLTLSGLDSEEQLRTHLLPKFANWVGVEHLVLEGAHHTPIIEAMTADRSQFPKLAELSLVETDIPGEILEKLVTSRINQESAMENGTKRLRKLTLNGCKGINRALCEGLTTTVDKLIVC
jgi:hypothetical protein